MELNVEYVKNVLKNNGYKYTNQRAEVYNVFLNHRDEHLSTEDVFAYVSKEDPEIGIATVYRTLMLFEELGVLYKISFDDGVARYEIKTVGEGHRHHHLVCLDCGGITEVKLDLLDSLEEEIENDEKFKIVDHNLKFYGYCKDCYKKRRD
ncbi:Fur family transcriptional regulator [Peptoniphilus sp. oral taxon 386]|uniref:Fur family transcriptional regulator n=1 Tax=Peptoniphilus sp. oral taxon 386 TaxID=652713 RepID=UPI0001DA9C97|nr:Fur family transcriptional regulator [Peptoniphilus sp. oral taxon 386]EFI42439.1 putative ferric uptake regulator [Peptoniphilus sp. oral taxon 386 str. F0131]